VRLDGGRCLRNHRRNIELREKWLISTVLWLNYSREQHLEKLSLKVGLSSFCQEIFKKLHLYAISLSRYMYTVTHTQQREYVAISTVPGNRQIYLSTSLHCDSKTMRY